MENYKQKYEAALKQAKQELKACGSLDCDAARQIFRLFPELQKSEDERIKTNIIKLLIFVRDTHHQYFDECSEAIEWLKRQDEQGSQEKLALEAVKEEKVDDANKVEPKFKVGDWVIFKDDSVYQVEKIENYEYTLRHFLGGSMPLPFGSRNLIRPWTIQDAKSGDVLVCEGKISKDKYGQEIGIVNKYVGRIGGCDNCFETYCFIDWEGNFIVGKDMGSSNIHPATKEQRDLLFQKMKEEGYEWDSSRKELIKLYYKHNDR